MASLPTVDVATYHVDGGVQQPTDLRWGRVNIYGSEVVESYEHSLGVAG